MQTPESSSVMQLYQQVVTAHGLQLLQQQAAMKFRRGIYCVRVVMWLMILQRLHRGATLGSAVQLLIQGAANPLLEDCHRVRCRSISSRTGSYCQARQKLPVLLCKQVNQQIVEQLQQILGQDPNSPPVVVLDGSSLELEHGRELVRSYPPAQNQHGKSHWPVLRVVVAHNVDTGLAYPPCWGPMYGSAAVSEQQLAEKIMAQLPNGATLLGDRNFGVFWMVYAAQQRGLRVLLRLTEPRARKLAGIITRPGEYAVVWKSGSSDGGKQRSVPANSSVIGRLIAARVGRGKSKQWLYLFTNRELPWQQIVDLYGRRGNIEGDLRSLKRTVNLHHLNAKSPDMLEKELLMAMSAYNLVRGLMTLAARQKGLAPRQLSFSGVLSVVTCAWPNLMAAATPQQQAEQIRRTLELAAQCTLPKRTKPRSYPRQVWRHCQAFPVRPSEKTK